MDRAEAIKRCDRYNEEWANARANDIEPFIAYNQSLDDLFYMAGKALREQEQSKWISVDERLPERKDANPYESVLAIHKDDGFARSWIFYVVAEYSQEFTHWMPLPEPPKEGVERTCETCYAKDMEHDEVDNPCWNCKGNHSEWSPKEGAEG